MRTIAAILVLITTACATQKQQLSAARTLSLHTEAVQAELQRFSDKRAIANQARQRTTNAREAERVVDENRNDESIRILELVDPDRLKLFRGIVAATNTAAARIEAAAEQRRANEALLAATKSHVATRNVELGNTAKILATLAERDSLKAQLTFYREFWKDVRKTIDEANKAAEEAAVAAPKEDEQ